jgi:hypothetical protein
MVHPIRRRLSLDGPPRSAPAVRGDARIDALDADDTDLPSLVSSKMLRISDTSHSSSVGMWIVALVVVKPLST